MNKSFLFKLILALSLSLTACSPSGPDARQAANDFFQQIGGGKLQEAYDHTAFSFQAQTSFKTFQATAKELGLTAGMAACNWIREEEQKREVKLRGYVLTQAGTSVPMTLTLIHERGEWRVFSLHTPNQVERTEENRFSLVGKGSAFSASANQEMPSPRLIRGLVVDSIAMFNDAIARQSFTQFYSKVSAAWQSQLTEGQLKRAFQPFIDAKVDMHEVRDLDPVLNAPPQINTEGILILKGYYDTKPHRIVFTLRFIYELPYWKLYGVEVQLEN